MTVFLRIKSPRRMQLRSRLNYLQVIPFNRDRSYSFFYDDESKEIDAVNDVVKAAGQETGEPEQTAVMQTVLYLLNPKLQYSTIHTVHTVSN